MASPKLRRLRNLLLAATLTGCGLWLTGAALWQLGKTAVFVHESVVVTGTVDDVRQRPFESWSETLGAGNWSMPGDISYQPMVTFLLPGGIHATRYDLPPDNEDYTTGESISIISPPDKPGKARINRWKFLWGASCLRLGVGVTLSLIGYGLLHRLRGKRPAKPKAPEQAKNSSPAKPPRKRKSTATAEDKPAPRRRKKAEGDPAPKKPRSRKKKAAPQQGELPL